jgi:hypothetical protein
VSTMDRTNRVPGMTGTYQLVELPSWTARIPVGEHVAVYGRLAVVDYEITGDGVTAAYCGEGHVLVRLNGPVGRDDPLVMWSGLGRDWPVVLDFLDDEEPAECDEDCLCGGCAEDEDWL